MKSNLVLLAFAAILVQSAIADPQPDPWIGEDTYHVVKGGVEDAAVVVADTAEKAWNEIQDTAKETAKIVGEAAEKAWDEVQSAIVDQTSILLYKAKNLGRTLEKLATERLGEFIILMDEFSNDVMKHIDDVAGDFLRTLIEESGFIFKLINETVDDIESFISKVVGTVSQEIIEQVMAKATAWEKWAEKEFRRVRRKSNDDAVKVQKAYGLLLAMLEYHSNELHSCSEDILTELDDFNDLAATIVSNLKHGMNGLHKTMKDCLSKDKIRKSSLFQCVRRAFKSIKELRRAPKDFVMLQTSALSIVTAGITDTGCALLTLAEYSDEKDRVTAKLKIIKRIKKQPGQISKKVNGTVENKIE